MQVPIHGIGWLGDDDCWRARRVNGCRGVLFNNRQVYLRFREDSGELRMPNMFVFFVAFFLAIGFVILDFLNQTV